MHHRSFSSFHGVKYGIVLVFNCQCYNIHAQLIIVQKMGSKNIRICNIATLDGCFGSVSIMKTGIGRIFKDDIAFIYQILEKRIVPELISIIKNRLSILIEIENQAVTSINIFLPFFGIS